MGYVRVSVRCHQFCNQCSKTDKVWRFQTDEQQTTNRWPTEHDHQKMTNIRWTTENDQLKMTDSRWPVKDNRQKMTNKRWPTEDDPQKMTYRRWPTDNLQMTFTWPTEHYQKTISLCWPYHIYRLLVLLRPIFDLLGLRWSEIRVYYMFHMFV